ncbi:cupin domain-containing protein [Serpentinicella alkaliphila]|uniref:Cupin domain n=1 Tax=Serpentinicella alkaliphila TaxID=1734049 RepID=A0A4R2TVM8_9FIRM|nr:cupin domain-containing protein [Serpentinicella alkaliphila]QUH26824.1 cupin domain-containing protein [Serpentinicella alkaliphila]TCQ08050.1 cupin domain [Serpentinicella alkaliphila]
MNKPFVFSEECDFEIVSEGIRRKILAYGEELMAVEVHFNKDAIGTIHSHPHTQLTYVLEGEFEFEINGIKQTVKKGDTLYKMSNQVHGCLCTKNGILLDIFTPYREDFIIKND